MVYLIHKVTEVSYMASSKKIEDQLDEIFVKKAPFQIPDNGRKIIVEWAPWINLVLGLFVALSAYWIWQAAHTVNQLVDFVNYYSAAAGTGTVTNKLGVFFWVSFIALLVSGALLLASVPGLKARSKARGWNIAYYAVWLNLFFGIIYMFDVHGGFGQLLSSALGTVIGLYVLFQIRGAYSDSKAKKEETKK
jgi:hypothetical protein